MKPTTEQLTSALIATFEGPVRLKSYQDTGGVWTIGQGHTAGVTAGMICTPEQSALWFREDQAPLFALVTGKPPLAQAAYVSFGYNCGRGALRKVLAGQDAIMNPVHQTDRTGATRAGLTSRRTLEDYLIRFSMPDTIAA